MNTQITIQLMGGLAAEDYLNRIPKFTSLQYEIPIICVVKLKIHDLMLVLLGSKSVTGSVYRWILKY